jgi:hypothetical protein
VNAYTEDLLVEQPAIELFDSHLYMPPYSELVPGEPHAIFLNDEREGLATS